MNSRMRGLAVLLGTVGLAALTPPQPNTADLETIERAWLAHEHDGPFLEGTLADDFLHPVSLGLFLNKRQHIDWAVKHPAPKGQRRRFDQLRVRQYGDVGIVTGIVVATDIEGKEDRSVFTDVFVRRNGRWQAVNAQENAVQPMPSRPTS